MLWTGQILTAALVASAAYARPPGFSPRAIPVPTRPLVWNDVNFITTSDIHGEWRALEDRADIQAGCSAISM